MSMTPTQSEKMAQQSSRASAARRALSEKLKAFDASLHGGEFCVSGGTSADKQVILKSMETAPTGGYYVWDGIDQEGRPMTRDEMEAGLAAVREAHSHRGKATKESSGKTHTTGAT